MKKILIATLLVTIASLFTPTSAFNEPDVAQVAGEDPDVATTTEYLLPIATDDVKAEPDVEIIFTGSNGIIRHNISIPIETHANETITVPSTTEENESNKTQPNVEINLIGRNGILNRGDPHGELH